MEEKQVGSSENAAALTADRFVGICRAQPLF